MYITCTICRELVDQYENVHVTKCGHIFHNECLSEWISRSQTCPQCRNKVTDECTFRMYPSTSNDSFGDFVISLQSRLDVELDLRQPPANTILSNHVAIKSAAGQTKKQIIQTLERKNDFLKRHIELFGNIIQSQKQDIKKLQDENKSLKSNIELSGKTIHSLKQDIQKMNYEIKVLKKNIELSGRGALTCHKCKRMFRAKMDYLYHMRAHEKAEQRAAQN